MKQWIGMMQNGNKTRKSGHIMKNIFRISALMCAMAFLTTSCVKDELLDEPQQKPAAVGDEIIFGSRAGFENSDKTTRTVYSGETYTVGTKTFERIDWLDNQDMVQIYCPEAKDKKVADYIVRDASTDENGTDKKDEGYLENLNADVYGAALQWGSDDAHKFYAMYPAPSQFKNATVAMGIQMVETTLHGIVPNNQVPATDEDNKPIIEETIENGNKVLIIKPNMDYAYMAAKAVASPKDGAVSLNFVPIVTAVEIELEAQKDGTTIKELRILGGEESDNTCIAGPFTADLSDKGWPVEIETDEKTGKKTLTYKKEYPNCINESSCSHEFNNDNGQYTIDLKQNNFIQYSPNKTITLNANEKLRFTVFLRPGVDYTNLKVGYSNIGADYVFKTLGSDSEPLTVQKHMKTKFTRVRLPGSVDWNAKDWMKDIPNERMLGYLSLPGTGGSFSYNYKKTDSAHYRQQNADWDITQQWETGIRAFEIEVDRVEEYIPGSIYFNGHYKAKSLNDEEDPAYVKCNKTSMGVKFDDAMQILEKAVTDNSKECAVVILVYQPEDNSPNRNASMFAESLKLWWESIGTRQDKYKKYVPNTTLGDVRGKILLIVRPNQRDEKDNGSFKTAKTELDGCPFVLIDGCGTAKDRWGARGYSIDEKRSKDINNTSDLSANDSNATDIIENYMHKPITKTTNWFGQTTDYYKNGCSAYIFEPNYTGENSSTYTINEHTIKRPGIDGDGIDFSFETETDGIYCWYQEWDRVVYPEITTPGHSIDDCEIMWFESLYEKRMNISETFNYAINSNPITSNTIYINSLCGYLVTTDFKDSYAPSLGASYGGSGGDIQALAKGDDANPGGLNAWFEALVNDTQLDQTAGPTGIIMMDYVEPTDQVIGTIISNNFKYNK